jgi:hypothetical protein
MEIVNNRREVVACVGAAPRASHAAVVEGRTKTVIQGDNAGAAGRAAWQLRHFRVAEMQKYSIDKNDGVNSLRLALRLMTLRLKHKEPCNDLFCKVG